MQRTKLTGKVCIRIASAKNAADEVSGELLMNAIALSRKMLHQPLNTPTISTKTQITESFVIAVTMS
jgi:hypothetical protein